MAERLLAKLPHGMGLPGPNYKIIRIFLLKHVPHGIHIVAGKAPIAARFQIAQAYLFGEAQFDASDTIRNLSGDKFETPSRAFMIEQDTRYSKHPKRLTVVNGNPVPVYFCDAVRTAWIKGGCLFLWDFKHFPKHFAGRSLIELDLRANKSNRFQHTCHADRSDISG